MRTQTKQHGFSLIEGLLIILVVSALSGMGWYVWNAQKDKETDKPANAVNASTAEKEEDNIPRGFVAYENKEIGFRFAHPKDWGTVKLEPNDPKNKGFGYYLSFSEKSEVRASFRTKDFEWPAGYGRGGAYFDAPTSFTAVKLGENDTQWDATNGYAAKSFETGTDYLLVGRCSEFTGSVTLEYYEQLRSQYDVGYFYYLLEPKENQQADMTGCDDLDSKFSPIKKEFTTFTDTIKPL